MSLIEMAEPMPSFSQIDPRVNRQVSFSVATQARYFRLSYSVVQRLQWFRKLRTLKNRAQGRKARADYTDGVFNKAPEQGARGVIWSKSQCICLVLIGR